MDPHAPILDSVLDGRTKGFPQNLPPTRLGAVGELGLRVTAGDTDFPVAVLKRSALDHNEAWMAEFLRRTGASLCPHGKTAMAPQLFHRQLAAGAWGITLATPHQARRAWPGRAGWCCAAAAHGLRQVAGAVRVGRRLPGAGGDPDLLLTVAAPADGSEKASCPSFAWASMPNPKRQPLSVKP